MRLRGFPRADLAVSVVGVGCNNFGARIDEAATKAVIDSAIESGVTLFDTAESYGHGESEKLLGRHLAGRRGQVTVATKFGWWNDPLDTGGCGNPDYVRSAVEASLRRLDTDYIDLYQYHRPDRVTPIVETLGAMNELIREGKVRYIGASNMTEAEIVEADRAAEENGLTPFISVQNEYSWLVRDAEQDVLPACARAGLGFIPFFPLASGLLTGKYAKGRPAPAGTRLAAGARLSQTSDFTWRRLEALEQFAARHAVSLLDVAIGGLAAAPAVTSVIAGATSPAQVRANVAAGEWIPSEEQMHELLNLS